MMFEDIRTKEGDFYVYKNSLGGNWVESTNTFDVQYPFNGNIVAKHQSATAKEAVNALDSAQKVQKEWAQSSAITRAEILEKASQLINKYADDLISTIVEESGKPISDAHHEVKAASDRLRFGSDEAKQLHGKIINGDIVKSGAKEIGLLFRQPLGVILGISPFNYPLYIPVSKIAPALAAGNVFVLKPTSADPGPAIMLVRILEEAGLPKGVVSVITGSGSEIGQALVAHPAVRMISFTGNSGTGKEIAQKAILAELHMELGGKSPGIVFEDADLKLAASECVKGAFKFSGQRCDAISRVLVHQNVTDEFTQLALGEAKKWSMGDPKDTKTQIGPLINETAAKHVQDLVDDATSKGAKVLFGGKRGEGLFFEPTLLAGVTTNMRIAWEETFGPVVTILSLESEDKMIEISNQSEFGLDASVFTNNINKAISAGLKIQSGTVQINAAPAHGVGNIPYGGDEDSGMGREGIGYSAEDMTKLHSIILNPKTEK